MKPITGRNIAAMLNPRLAALVTCCDADGQPNVLTVAWHTPLSHQPPLVGISVGHNRYSHHLIQNQAEFVINMMRMSHQQEVEFCGNHSGEAGNKLEMAGLQTYPAHYVCPPILADACGVLECRVIQQVETGDHTFFIGEILEAAVCAEDFSDKWESQGENGVLQCLQRNHYVTYAEVDKHGQPE